MDDQAERPDRERPLAGIGVFATRLAIGTAIAVVVAVVVLWLIGNPSGRGGDDARAQPETANAAAVPRDARARPPRTPEASDESAAGPIAREIERRHDAGELSEAQRRFEACPGGDLRRVAWIDRQQHVVKMIRHRADGSVVEEWFDETGRLREAAVETTAAGRPWHRRVALDEGGRETVLDVTGGLVPDEPPPPLVRSDPTGAFFSGAGCQQR